MTTRVSSLCHIWSHCMHLMCNFYSFLLYTPTTLGVDCLAFDPGVALHFNIAYAATTDTPRATVVCHLVVVVGLKCTDDPDDF